MQKEQNDNKIERPAVVAVLGHIDHGKSTLLDFIRKEKTADKEVGGITQRVSAYEAIIGPDKQRITFLDTPGHEAFCSIRERGSRLADIVVLVVSAEDGVKQQTIEAIKCIKENNTPSIVAINKIDKSNSNIEKTKQNLAENDILVESWGGSIPAVATSAKTGDGVDSLLEMILLQASILELKTDPNQPAEGFVVETTLDSKKGVSAVLVIKNGTLNKGDFVATKTSFVTVRSIENFERIIIDKATASSPIILNTWNGLPVAGDEFRTFKTKKDAMDFANSVEKNVKAIDKEITSKINFPIIIKTDNIGSLEAIKHELSKIDNQKILVKIVDENIGSIVEKDVKLAIGSKSRIIGFNVNPDKNASVLAMRDNIEIKTFNIIYELIDWLKEEVRKLEPKEQAETIIGKAKILKTFSKNKDKQVIGAKVESGEIKSGTVVKIYRRENQISTGKIKELQSQRVKTDSVAQGQEFGANIESKIEILPGDSVLSVSII